MPAKRNPKFDEIGYWSEVKLDIIKDYASEYSKILSAQTSPQLHHVYIDAFSGAGKHISRETGQFVSGSPLNALNITPPFCEYYLIDIKGEKIEYLTDQIGNRSDVHIKQGDCNKILLDEVFPNVRFDQYRRGLCLLDPYGLQITWEIVREAGQTKAIDLFLNFPVMDMNRNVLWKNPENVSELDIIRMSRFWGDDSWKGIAYRTEGNLFGFPEKEDTETIVNAFRDRLIKNAGFMYVTKPLPMHNSMGSVVYYLFFASQKNVAGNIVTYIFDKYRNRGIR
jgi:three-Cys-motif partner protein